MNEIKYNEKQNKLILTFFGAGFLRPAPGSWGSLAGLIVGVLIIYFFTLETLFLLAILFTLIGIREVDKYELNGGEHDSPNIVIDEVVGIWITMSMGLAVTINNETISILACILSFVFFRLFDIKKPSIIGRIDRDVKGGYGVMLDDVLAGFFAGILTLIILGAMIKFGYSEYIF
ncbi:MAG: phosphatidylglycerophosphatase A [Campylobacter sp.]|nr:phosphatidylglycerophosphatase A [Campylobacter sp.]